MGKQPDKKKGSGSAGGEDPLHVAARSGDLKSLQNICTSNPLSVNSRDKHSRTPLHLAAWAGHTELVVYLCKNKADVGAAAMDDMGAIHFAAQKGHLEVVRTLLSSGVSLKASNRKGFTPLHFAVQGSHSELVKYLARKGASFTAKTKAGKTPIDLAKDEEMRSCLLELEELAKKGEDQNVKDKSQESDSEDKAVVSDEKLKEDITPGSEQVEEEDKVHEVENQKRKSNESEGILSEPKKPKIALNHLMSADYDTQEDNL